MFMFSPHRGMRGRGRGRGRRRSPGHRDRSRSSSGSASPTGDPALDAQDALRRRLERAKKKQQEKAEREKAEMEAKLESGEGWTVFIPCTCQDNVKNPKMYGV